MIRRVTVASTAKICKRMRVGVGSVWRWDKGVSTWRELLKRLQTDDYEGIMAIELHTLRELTERVFDDSIQYLKDHGVL